MGQLTLIAQATVVASPSLPDGFTIARPEPDDAERLGRLYFDAHGGTAHADVGEAIEEMRRAFQGEFGQLWPAACGLVERDGELAAGILTVHRAPWPDTPDCPFITDLFTDLRFRRQGIARVLVARCLAIAGGTSRPEVALRVESENEAAVRLYESLGFRPVA